MLYWDSSAIVPLLVTQSGTRAMERILQEDRCIATWWGTPIECTSAIARAERSGALTRKQADAALESLAELQERWTEIQPTDDVRETAAALLRRHPLRAADALQLAAARVWAEDDPSGYTFISLDDRLATAARGEGLEVTTT